MAAGSIVVDLLMRTGSFQTDTKRAAAELKKFKKEAADTGKVIGAALVAGAVTAAGAFDILVKSAADFQDLAEMTGASAEDLASLAVAAGTAGVSMDTLAANSIRLTKSLVGVDDESKAAGAAVKYLGLNLEDFKKLDPVGQIDALAAAFGELPEGQNKAAVATALWGKSGAEMLKVMKALEEQGGRIKILTQQQIDDADAYADAQAKAATELRLYASAAMTQGAPAFLALTNAASDFIKEIIGVDKETGKLSQSTAIRDFAVDAVKAIGFVIDAGDGVIRVFKGVGLAVGAAAAAAAAVVSGEFNQARSIVGALVDDIDELANRKLFSTTLNERLESVGQPGPAKPAQRSRDPFAGAIAKGSKGAKAQIDEVAKAIQELEKELALFGQDDSFKKAFDLQGLGASAAQIDQYKAKLKELDRLKTAEEIQKTIDALAKERDELGLTNDQLTIRKLVLDGATEQQVKFAESIQATIRAFADQKAIREAQAAADDYIASLKRAQETELLGFGRGNRERQRLTGRQSVFDKSEDDVRSLNNARRASLLSGAFGPEQERRYQQELAIIRSTQQQALAIYDDGVKKRTEFEADWVNGASEAANNYIDAMKNAAQRAGEFFSNVFGKAEDSLTEFLSKGKTDLKGFGDFLVAEFSRNTARNFLSTIVGATKDQAGKGGIVDSIGSLLGPFFGGKTASGMSSTTITAQSVTVISGPGSANDSIFSGLFGEAKKAQGSIAEMAKSSDAASGSLLDLPVGLKDFIGSLGDIFSGMFQGGGNPLESIVGSIFGGFRAGGGGVEAGKAYVVGERRPELFVPRTAGTILPSLDAVSTQRGGDNFNFRLAVNSNGYMDRAAEERSAARIARSVQERTRRKSA